jgi:hypothetical protein
MWFVSDKPESKLKPVFIPNCFAKSCGHWNRHADAFQHRPRVSGMWQYGPPKIHRRLGCPCTSWIWTRPLLQQPFRVL